MPNTTPPHFYSLIGHSFRDELLRLLAQGEHVALLGPPHGGKSILLAMLQTKADQVPKEADRPRIVTLSWEDCASLPDAKLYRQAFAKIREDVDLPDYNPRLPLAANLVMAVTEYLRKEMRPLWIFVGDLVGFSKPAARQILLALLDIHRISGTRGRSAAVVTGSSDFISLTYDENSPYSYAKAFLVVGMEFDFAKCFMAHRRRFQRMLGDREHGADWHSIGAADELRPLVAKEMTDAAYGYLYDFTGGQSHFMQEIIVSSVRHPQPDVTLAENAPWTLNVARHCAQHYVRHHMASDYYVREITRRCAADSDAFDLLLRIVQPSEDARPLRLPDGRPHVLEAIGVASRDATGTPRIASPLWSGFLGGLVTAQYCGDILALEGKWQEAWKAYRRADARLGFRAINGDDRQRLDHVLVRWADSFFEMASLDGAVDRLFESILTGACHLLGISRGGVYDPLTAKYTVPQCLRPILKAPQTRPIEDMREAPFRETSTARFWLTRSRARSVSCLSPSGVGVATRRLVLVLERQGIGYEIDASSQPVLWHVLDRFWQALVMACDIEHARMLGGVAQRLARVQSKLNQEMGRTQELGSFVTRIPGCLVEEGGYGRVLVCLVNPCGNMIQGIADCCASGRQRFPPKFTTNFCVDHVLPKTMRADFPPDPNDPDHALWMEWVREHHRGQPLDVQEWVACTGQSIVIPDASTFNLGWLKTQDEKARSIGMHGIAIVPMLFDDPEGAPGGCRRVFGTIHFERLDGSAPSTGEVEFLQSFANQVAAMFHTTQRLDILTRGVNALPDQFRIINGQRQVLFANSEAVKVMKTRGNWPDIVAGWYDGRKLACVCGRSRYCIECAGCQEPRATCLLQTFQEEPQRPAKSRVPDAIVSHYTRLPICSSDHSPERVLHSIASPLRDFRNGLQAPYADADDVVGYLESEHDITRLYLLVDAAHRWVGAQDMAGLATNVLSFHTETAEHFRAGEVWLRSASRESESLERIACHTSSHRARSARVIIPIDSNDASDLRRGLSDGKHGPWLFWHGDWGKTSFSFAPSEARLLSATPCPLAKGTEPHCWIVLPLRLGANVVGLARLLMHADAVTTTDPADWELWGLSGLLAGAAMVSLQTRNLEVKATAQAKAMEAWRSFSARAAHRIGNQTFPIAGNADLLRCTSSHPKATIWARRILDSVAAINFISKEFQQFSTPPPLRLEQVSLREFLEDVATAATPASFPHRWRIRVRPKDLCQMLDRKRMSQALAELIEDSCQFCGTAKQLGIGIVATRTESGDGTMIVYTDNGPGIPAALREKVFEPFETTRAEGTGLGLAIVRQIIEQHGGPLGQRNPRRSRAASGSR